MENFLGKLKITSLYIEGLLADFLKVFFLLFAFILLFFQKMLFHLKYTEYYSWLSLPSLFSFVEQVNWSNFIFLAGKGCSSIYRRRNPPLFSILPLTVLFIMKDDWFSKQKNLVCCVQKNNFRSQNDFFLFRRSFVFSLYIFPYYWNCDWHFQ